MSIKKILVSAAVTVLGVVGVMNVAIADVPTRVTVCVESNGQGSPDHAVTVPIQAADAPAFDGCGASYGGGFGGGFGGRVSAADTNDELAETR